MRIMRRMVRRAVPGMERPRERASFSLHESQGAQDWGRQEGREGVEERDEEGVVDEGVVKEGVVDV